METVNQILVKEILSMQPSFTKHNVYSNPCINIIPIITIPFKESKDDFFSPFHTFLPTTRPKKLTQLK